MSVGVYRRPSRRPPRTEPARQAAPLPRPPRWTEHAACLGLAGRDADPWHDFDRTTLEGRALLIEARRTCQGCPVRLDCFRYALGLIERAGYGAQSAVRGIFAGLTPRELKALARRLALPARKIAQHGSRSAYVAGCRCGPCRNANARSEHERRLIRAAAG